MSQLNDLHEHFCNYSLTFKGNSPKTIKDLKICNRSFCEISSVNEVEGLTREAVESWIFWGKETRKWGPKTIQNKLKYMSLFCDWLVQRDYVKTNLIKNIPKPKLPKRLPKSLKKDEAFRLLEWIQHFPFIYKYEKTRASAIIATFLYTGIRHDELRNLKISHVNFESRSLLVESGKGMKDRLIPLNLNLITILEKYLKDRSRLKKGCPYFFTAMRQDSKMGSSVIPRFVERIRKKSGIHFYPHMLRHTFATLMLEGGCDLFSLSKMMGHADIKTTTIYLSATTAHLQEQICKHPL